MTKIQKLINQLRNTANQLESFFVTDESNESSNTKKKILSIKKKVHWTQLPKNRKKLEANLKKMRDARWKKL